MKTKLYLSLLLSFYFCLLSSQIPQGFTYQAIATEGGHPVIALIDVRITIQSDSITPVTTFWVEEHTSVQPNESGLFTLVVGKGTRISGSAAIFNDIDWRITPKFILTEINYNGWKTMGSSRLWSVPFSMVSNFSNTSNVANDLGGPLNKLGVAGIETGNDDALFEVKNKFNKTVFAVYNEGVRVYVDNGIAKSAKGGFAIGGFGTKGDGQEYLRVDPGIINLHIDDKTKSAKGGFAIGGFGSKGGANFLNVEASSDATTISPSENRILWYPYKNAFFAGRVLIESAGDVGENSFATGFESKAKGSYSQAMGYQAVTIGSNSTAIGNNTTAEGPNSFAMGEHTKSTGISATAMGSNTWAQGDLSTTMGYGTHTIGTGGTALGFSTTAKGDYSTAMGINTIANGTSSLALGSQNLAYADNSTVMGFQSKAGGDLSTAIGYKDTTRNTGSIAIGYMSSTSGDYSVGIGAWNSGIGTASAAIGGYGNEAHGEYSFVTGEWSKTHGTGAFASGFYADAIGNNSQAFGDRASAVGQTSTAFGWLTSSTGTLSIAMGDNTTAQSYASLVIGRFNIISGSNSWQPTEPAFVIGNGSDGTNRSNALTVLKSGDIYAPGMATGSGSTPSHVVTVGTGGRLINYLISSSIKYKRDVIDMEGIDWLYNLHPVNFSYINDITHHKEYGLIAEEVEKVNPSFVDYDEKGNIQSVYYQSLIAPLIKSAQDQEHKIEALSNENQLLKKQLKSLQEKMDQIEVLLSKSGIK